MYSTQSKFVEYLTNNSSEKKITRKKIRGVNKKRLLYTNK